MKSEDKINNLRPILIGIGNWLGKIFRENIKMFYEYSFLIVYDYKLKLHIDQEGVITIKLLPIDEKQKNLALEIRELLIKEELEDMKVD